MSDLNRFLTKYLEELLYGHGFRFFLRRNQMISQWFRQLSTKQIIALVIAVLLAIYVVWYVMEALEGFDPEYKPSGLQPSNWDTGSKTGVEAFDPTKGLSLIHI